MIQYFKVFVIILYWSSNPNLPSYIHIFLLLLTCLRFYSFVNQKSISKTDQHMYRHFGANRFNYKRNRYVFSIEKIEEINEKILTFS